MAEYLIQEETLTNIANAIRTKTGKSEDIIVSNMADEINDIDIDGAISTHNEDETAHPYILGELTAIRTEHTTAIDALETVASGKADKTHTHAIADVTDFPTSMPASDVSDWAKAASKPTYTASEVGAAESSHTHAAGDITSGTLPVARGGTGVTSLSSLASNLSSYLGGCNIEMGSYSGSNSQFKTLTFNGKPYVVIIQGKIPSTDTTNMITTLPVILIRSDPICATYAFTVTHASTFNSYANYVSYDDGWGENNVSIIDLNKKINATNGLYYYAAITK